MAAVVDSEWATATKVWIFPYFLLHDEVWVMKVLAGDEETAKVLKERMGEGMDMNTGEVSFRVVANYERDRAVKEQKEWAPYYEAKMIKDNEPRRVVVRGCQLQLIRGHWWRQ